jgi:hypothetical protein
MQEWRINEKYDIIQFKNALQKLEAILKEKNLLPNHYDSMLTPVMSFCVMMNSG